jgi:hypothetical protein
MYTLTFDRTEDSSAALVNERSITHLTLVERATDMMRGKRISCDLPLCKTIEFLTQKGESKRTYTFTSHNWPEI